MYLKVERKNDLLQHHALKPVFLHQVHHLFGYKMPAFYPKNLIAVVEIEIYLTAREMVQQKTYQPTGLPGPVYIGFKNFYHSNKSLDHSFLVLMAKIHGYTLLFTNAWLQSFSKSTCVQ